jgi:hypothetical protein
LDEARRRQAFEDVRALKHATFRYKKTATGKKAVGADEPATAVTRGLIYEDAPDSIRGAGKSIVLDQRVLNLELALQEADNKIAALEAQISVLEKQKAHR